MSIRDAIRDRIEEGKLFRVVPVMPYDRVRRELFVSAEINRLLTGPWKHEAMERRCNELRANLEAFVKGDQISICLIPRKARTAYMARLDAPSDEVWEIRVRDPRPNLRLLGRFAWRDAFVSLLWAPRTDNLDWASRPPWVVMGRESGETRSSSARHCGAIYFNLMSRSVEALFMTTSQQTSFLSEITAGVPIPAGKLAYFQERTRNNLYHFILTKFLEKERAGELTKAQLARRIGRSPEVITRLLGAPGNYTIGTISDLLLGIAAEEIEPASRSVLQRADAGTSAPHDLTDDQGQRALTKTSTSPVAETNVIRFDQAA